MHHSLFFFGIVWCVIIVYLSSTTLAKQLIPFYNFSNTPNRHILIYGNKNHTQFTHWMEVTQVRQNLWIYVWQIFYLLSQQSFFFFFLFCSLFPTFFFVKASLLHSFLSLFFIMSVANPPRRPFKSRLRKTISISQISSPIPQSPIQSPVSPTESIQGAFSTEDLYSKLRVTPGIPPLNAFKSTEQGRFSDQYLSSTSLRTSEDTASIDIKKYNTSNMKGSQSLTTSLRDSLTPPASVQDTEDYKVIEKPTTGIKIKSSISTPLQLPKGVPRLVPRKFGSNGSLITPKTVPTPSYIKNNSSTSVNRAQAIIQRLENWNSLLKGLTAWLEEASKITMSSSRAFAVRAYSVLNGDDNEHDVNHNFYSTLQELTMQLAAEQQEVSNSLEHEHLPDLQKLRKECRDKIQKLKADQSLSADELLRRAELTRAKMTHLDRCCKQADKATGQVEMDPWVANLCLYTSFFFF
jgi:hypothetical protein